VDAALHKAVRKTPAKRYATMSAFELDLTRPNPKFDMREKAPLLERDPVKVWKWLAGVSLLANLILAWLLAA